MSKRDEKIATYADQLKGAGVSVDMDLLTKVTIGLGPSIYNQDAETVAGSSDDEKATVKNNYLIKKLGLSDSPALDAGIEKVIDTLGRSNKNKYRACMYYLLCREFKKESVYA